MSGAFSRARKRRVRTQLDLLATVFGFSVRFREVGVIVLEHFVLIAVAQLAAERAVLGAASALGVRSVVFYCAFAQSFVRSS
jgi:hypothetical protein